MFPQEARHVFANMMFNLGYKKLRGFRKMIAHAKAGRWRLAGVEGRDSRWYRQVTTRAERLMKILEVL